MLACRNVGRQLLIGVQASLGEPFGHGRTQLDLPGGHSATTHLGEEPELRSGLHWPLADMLGRGQPWDVGASHIPGTQGIHAGQADQGLRQKQPCPPPSYGTIQAEGPQ